MYHIKNDKRSIQSSEFIYEALKQLMSDKKFSDITVTELVNQAKIGRSTFYRNFDSIEDVLSYKSDQSYGECGEYLLRVLSSYAHNESPQRSFFLPFFRYWYSHFEVIELLIHIGREDILKRSFIKMVDDLRSQYPEVTIEHYEYFLEMRAATSIALLTQWVKSKRKETPEGLYTIFHKQTDIDQYLFDMARYLL